MNITDITLIPLSASLKEPIMDSRHFIPKRECLIVRVETNEGVYGIGESAIFGGALQAVSKIIQKEISPLIKGENPLYRERLWQKIYQRTMQHGRQGLIIMAMSGIDIALFDLLGKVTNTPLYLLLGGFKDKVPAYASGGFYQDAKGIDELTDEIQRAVAKGFRAVKIKVARNPSILLKENQKCKTSLEEDISRVKAVREVIGPKIDLMVDANNEWSPKTAIKFGQEIEQCNPYFFEEPVATDDIDGSAQVAKALSIPIAGYETEYTKFGFRELIRKHAVDIVQPDVTWAGGITEVKKIAAFAETHNIRCIPHCFSSAVSLAATIHLIASIPNGKYLEFDINPNPLREDLLEEKLEVCSDGYVKVPQKPGLGIKLNKEAIAFYKTKI